MDEVKKDKISEEYFWYEGAPITGSSAVGIHEWGIGPATQLVQPGQSRPLTAAGGPANTTAGAAKQQGGNTGAPGAAYNGLSSKNARATPPSTALKKHKNPPAAAGYSEAQTTGEGGGHYSESADTVAQKRASREEFKL